MRGLICLAILAPLTFAGCVAVWGKGHNVIYENSEGIMIEYDPVFASQPSLAQIAQASAARYGKVIEPGQYVTHAGGIHQRHYKFVKPTD